MLLNARATKISKIKAFLAQYPRLNKLVRAVYIPPATKFVEFRQYLRRNRLGEWWSKEGDTWGEGYWDSINHPHRSFLVERVAAFSPISSVLEIGCGSGPNLYNLARRFPDAEIVGIDVRSHAIQAGKEGFASEGMTNVQLSVGRAEDLSQFKDRSFDVVFTDAVLIYVKRGDIQRVIKEMMRIVRGGIVLVECHDFEHQPGDRQGLGVFKRGLWVRDYTTLLKQFVPENQINITKLTKEVWPPDGWGRNGALIEVTLQSSSSIAAKRGAKDNPLVSVITPVLNGVKYLEECIQSVLNQDYPYIEHIIVDGGSTDGTVDILSGYQAKYPDRIRFVSEPGTGVGEALNRGLGMAKGGIFGWVNADDFYEPGAVPTVVEFFKANPDAYFVFGGCNFINEKGEITGKYATKDFDLKKMINKANYIPQPSAFFRREVIERVGWFETLIGSDRDYWIRAGMVFPIHRIEKVLSSFRVHAGSATTGSSKEIRRRHLRADYITTRRFGGSIFSRYCREYYRFVIIEGLRPVLGFTYPLIKRVLER